MCLCVGRAYLCFAREKMWGEGLRDARAQKPRRWRQVGAGACKSRTWLVRAVGAVAVVIIQPANGDGCGAVSAGKRRAAGVVAGPFGLRHATHRRLRERARQDEEQTSHNAETRVRSICKRFASGTRVAVFRPHLNTSCLTCTVVGEGSRSVTLWGPRKLASHCERITFLAGEEFKSTVQGVPLPLSPPVK